MREINNEIKDITKNYDDAVAKIESGKIKELNDNTTSFLREQIELQVELEESIKKQNEEATKLYKEYEIGEKTYSEYLEDKKELDKELLELETRLRDVKLNISELSGEEVE